MTKDVLISIKGLQFDTSAEPHQDSVELIVAGQYHKKGDTITVEFYRYKNGRYSKESTKVTF